MSYKPSGAYYAEFTTQRFDTGAATNADSTPAATANKNGTDDGSFTLTVTNIDTGRYKITGTVPSGYASGDVVNVSVAATVNSVAGKGIVDSFTVQVRANDDLAFPATTGRSLAVDASGLVDGNVKKINDVATTAVTTVKAVQGLTNADTITDYTGNTKQTGDSFSRLGAPSGASIEADIAAIFARLGIPAGASTAADIAAVLVAVNNINNLSALANLFAPSTMARPASGSIAYPFTFVVKDAEGHAVDVDSNTVTLTATNAAGTDRSSKLSSVTHSGTGEYTFTYTVSSTDPDEGLRITAAGTVASATRKAYANAEVADADSLTALAAIQAQTDKLLFDGSNFLKSTPQTGVTLAAIQSLYAPAKAGDKMDIIDIPNATAIAAIQNGLATATALAAAKTILDSITIRLPDALVSGNLKVLVEDVVAGAVTTIQNGLATAASLSNVSARLPDVLVSGNLKSIVQALGTGIVTTFQDGLATSDKQDAAKVILDSLTLRLPAALDGDGNLKTAVQTVVQAVVDAIQAGMATAAGLTQITERTDRIPDAPPSIPDVLEQAKGALDFYGAVP